MIRQTVKQNQRDFYHQLKHFFNSQKVAHAFLFNARRGYQIDAEWKLLAQWLIYGTEKVVERDILSYADLIVINGQKETIKKEQVMMAIEKLMQTPLEKQGVKILTILNIENASKATWNSLLKFLEDPVPSTFIILTTNHYPGVLDTIKSRCQLLILKPPQKDSLLGILQKEYPSNYRLISYLMNDYTQAKELNQQINKYLKPFIKALKQSIDNHHLFYFAFDQLIDSKNFQFIFRLLHVFINDLWKYPLQKNIFTQSQVIEKYIAANFPWTKALAIINDFQALSFENLSFELIKSEVLTKLKDCYG